MVLAAGLAGHAAADPVHDVVAGARALQRGHLAAPRLCQGLAAHLHAPRSQKVPLHGPSLRGRPVGTNLPLCTLLLLTNLPLMIALHAEQHNVISRLQHLAESPASFVVNVLSSTPY